MVLSDYPLLREELAPMKQKGYVFDIFLSGEVL
jgi:hypothetical protein